MATKKCPYCGKENDIDNDVCILCGKNISNDNAKKIATRNNESVSFFVAIIVVFLLFIVFLLLKENNNKEDSNINQKKERIRKNIKKIIEAECRQDLKCWADENKVDATVSCMFYIQKLAKYSYKWTDGIMHPKISYYGWKDKNKGYITYIGDRIKLQNGFGAWQNYVYECDYDTKLKTLIDVRINPGKL